MPLEVIVATVVLLLPHVPPAVASLRVIIEPAHTDVGPVIAGGLGLTVTMAVVAHPVELSVNVILDVPDAIPLTTPVVIPIVATPVLPLLHVPLPDTSLSVLVAPKQMLRVPLIAGRGFTVTTAVV
jgi:hypothetical protein